MKPILLTAVLLALAACSSKDQVEPRGIGRDVNDLKRSPCACIEIKQDYTSWKKYV